MSRWAWALEPGALLLKNLFKDVIELLGLPSCRTTVSGCAVGGPKGQNKTSGPSQSRHVASRRSYSARGLPGGPSASGKARGVCPAQVWCGGAPPAQEGDGEFLGALRPPVKVGASSAVETGQRERHHPPCHSPGWATTVERGIGTGPRRSSASALGCTARWCSRTRRRSRGPPCRKTRGSTGGTPCASRCGKGSGSRRAC